MNYQSIIELFDQAAENFHNHVAIERADERVTYTELVERSNNLANFLVSQGAASGSIIAILAEDAIEVIAAIIGVLKAGCVFVPLEPRIPEKRLQTMVAEVSPTWFIIESKFLPRLENIAAGGGAKARIICVGGQGAHVHQSESMACAEHEAIPPDTWRPSTAPGPDDMCYIYFTSGSTGKPKGIAGRRKGIDHFVQWEIKTLDVTEGTRISQLTGASFDAILRDIFVPLCAGGTICVPETRETIINAARLIEWLDNSRINIVHCVPTVFRSIINERLRPEYFSALKYILMAGEPLLPADVKRWMEVYGERVQLINLYGPTETTMTKFFYFVKPSDQERRFIPIGQPMEGARALVIDAKGQACPPGAVGEIYIRTPFRTLGYYNQLELTKEVFVQNPFSNNPNDIVYKTGDLGRVLEDGNFEFLGRKDSQVKVRGVRIELAEIESQLREYEAVKNVAVIDREDSRGDKYLCAYTVLSREVDPGALRSFLSQRLPEYMMPAVFMQVDELPMTLSGKVDRRALPDPEQSKALTAFVPPRTPVEQKLAELWSQVLNVKQVGINDNFFDLRGHSLLATRLLSLVRETFEIEIPLRSLFDAPTIAALAENIEQARRTGVGTEVAPLRSVSRDKPLPLSFAQQRLWFLDQLQPGNPLHNLPLAVRLTGHLHRAALEQTINEIIRRHEALRTRFAVVEGQAVQVIAPELRWELPVADLSHLPDDESEAEVKRIAGDEARQQFDLSTGPLLRARLLRLSMEEYVLLFTMHHIVSDGWSMSVLVREVSAIYPSVLQGRPSPLPPLPIQYADYALWQREQLQGEVLERQLSYWREQLMAAPQVLELPTDRPRPAVQSFRGAVETFLLNRELTEDLKQLSREQNVTLFMTLLSAFQTLLYRYSGQEDILVGTPIANRTHRETEDLIGFFVNTLVLRNRFTSELSFRELLEQTREVTLGAYAHQELPFERLVEELQPERSLSHTPLFQVWFVLDDIQLEPLNLPDLTLSQVDAVSETTQFDLVLSMYEFEQQIGGALKYSTDLFDRETIAEMTESLQHLLAEIAARPDYCLLDIPLHQDEQSSNLSAASEPQNLEPAEDQFAL
jgi:amino acid adenylation domain-containing protein